MLQEEFVALIRHLCSAKTGVLAHRPEASTIHTGMHATREGELTGKVALLQIGSIWAVQRRVQPFERDARRRGERRLALRETRQYGLDDLRLPALLLSGNFLVIMVCCHPGLLPLGFRCLAARMQSFSGASESRRCNGARRNGPYTLQVNGLLTLMLGHCATQGVKCQECA